MCYWAGSQVNADEAEDDIGAEPLGICPFCTAGDPHTQRVSYSRIVRIVR